jgi:hypothetical protein
MPVKKYIALLLSAFLLMALSVSCGQKEPAETTVTQNFGGQDMTVTFAPGSLSAGTITSDKGSYTFAYEGSGDLKITYPDGSGFTYRKTGNSFAGMASPAFDPESKGYPDGITMAWGIESAIKQAGGGRKNDDGPSPLLAIFLLAVGAWNTFAPRSAWYLSRGWQFKDAEPSEAALAMNVLAGAALLFAGGICLLAAIF